MKLIAVTVDDMLCDTMARPVRIDTSNGIYHVTSRGLDRQPIVRDDGDRQKWTELLDRVATRRGWRVFAWALMDNHWHAFLRVPHGDLSPGMHDLNAGYASAFNRRHGRCGHLFQGRFKGILVEERYHYWELSRYIHLNPVRAGLVADAAAFPWGSCRFYFNRRGAPDWLEWEAILAEHGRGLRAARRAYRAFLQAGVTAPPESPLTEATASTLLGSCDFVDRMREWLQDRLPDRDVPAARELRANRRIEEVVEAVCASYGVAADHVLRRGRRRNQARLAAVYLCRSLTGASVRAIGLHFGGVNGQAISNLVRKVTRERLRDRKLRSRLSAIEEALS